MTLFAAAYTSVEANSKKSESAVMIENPFALA
jgi:hypothetical protein